MSKIISPVRPQTGHLDRVRFSEKKEEICSWTAILSLAFIGLIIISMQWGPIRPDAEMLIIAGANFFVVFAYELIAITILGLIGLCSYAGMGTDF